MNAVDAVRYLKGVLQTPRFEEVDRHLGLELPFPVPALISEEMSAPDSLELWQSVDDHRSITGLTPVLLGAEPMIDWSARRDDLMDRIRAHREGAAQSSSARLAQVEARLVSRFSPQVVEQLRSDIFGLPAAWLLHPSHRTCGLESADDLHAGFLEEPEPVRCVLLRCKPHEVPLYLGLGGWNGSPEPHEQAAFLRRWQRFYDTRLVHVGRSGIELWSMRPPRRLEESRRLLWEVFLYCHDAVLQDASMTELRGMLASHRWRFWWD